MMMKRIGLMILLLIFVFPSFALAEVYTAEMKTKSISLETKPLQVYNPNVQTPDWGIKYIDINRWWSQGYNGKGVKIAVIDTGIDYLHHDLRGNVAGGVSVVPYTKSYMDDHSHGSHVSGIIAAVNNRIGSIGVAHGAKLYAVKALDSDGSGTVANLVKAVRWSIDNGMDIINMSIGMTDDEVGTADFKALEKAINEAYSKGIYIVAASGNEGRSKVSYPANFPVVIAVGAVYEHVGSVTGKTYPMWANFSNYGRKVEVVAPGAFIYSAYPRAIETFWNSPVVGYEFETGTSMATPYVSGFLAVLKQKYPNDSMYKLRTRLHQNTVKVGTVGQTGHGMIKVTQK